MGKRLLASGSLTVTVSEDPPEIDGSTGCWIVGGALTEHVAVPNVSVDSQNRLLVNGLVSSGSLTGAPGERGDDGVVYTLRTNVDILWYATGSDGESREYDAETLMAALSVRTGAGEETSVQRVSYRLTLTYADGSTESGDVTQVRRWTVATAIGAKGAVRSVTVEAYDLDVSREHAVAVRELTCAMSAAHLKGEIVRMDGQLADARKLMEKTDESVLLHAERLNTIDRTLDWQQPGVVPFDGEEAVEKVTAASATFGRGDKAKSTDGVFSSAAEVIYDTSGGCFVLKVIMPGVLRPVYYNNWITRSQWGEGSIGGALPSAEKIYHDAGTGRRYRWDATAQTLVEIERDNT